MINERDNNNDKEEKEEEQQREFSSVFVFKLKIKGTNNPAAPRLNNIDTITIEFKDLPIEFDNL